MTEVPDVRCDGPGAILVGVDGSTSSMRAAAYAAGLARRQRCRLVAVYVRTLPPMMLSVADVVAAQDAVERQLRDAVEERHPVLNVDVDLVVREGEPYAELLDVARQFRADAVIVGRSTKILHRITGSLAVKLVRCGRWPVTVVP